MSKQRSDGIDNIFKRIEQVLYDIDWFQSERHYQNAVLGCIFVEYRISFGRVTPELFEELKQNSFFLEVCNRLRITQHDCVLKASIELSYLRTLTDN